MNSANSSTHSRGKLLIPGLLLVLLLVLIWPGKKSETSPAVPQRPPAHSNRLEPVAHLTSVTPTVAANMISAPVYTLRDAIAINPFAQPAPSAAPSQPLTMQPIVQAPDDVEDPEQPAASPATAQLQAIFFDRSGAAAIIEDRILRIGDRLADGRTIVRITKQGVELTP